MALPRMARSDDRIGRNAMPVQYPPFEFQADREALRAIASGITGIKVEDGHNVWLRDKDGRSWLIAVQSRDLRFKFEVFSLAVRSIEQLRVYWRDWKPPIVPPGVPEPFRSLMSARPSEPAAPTVFDNWPFATRSVEVLRRVEFITENVDVGLTVGDNPNAQSATRPGRVPKEASATCEVAVGLLFNGQGDERLLLAADWMPMDLMVTQEAGKIDVFIADCERVELGAYTRLMGQG